MVSRDWDNNLKNKYHKSSGFTLTEVLITMAIVAILATVAVPAYNAQIAKGRRADAHAGLLSLGQAMERVRSDRGSYAWANGNADAIVSSTAPTIYPSQLPVDGNTKFYNLRVISADGSSYLVEAIPINGQVGDGNLSFSSNGLKRWDRGNDGYNDPADHCWANIC